MNRVVEPIAPIVDLFDVLEGNPALAAFSFTQYLKGEDEILRPHLLAAGYQLEGEFWTGEGDSFGPLSRCIYARKDGQRVCLIYG